MRYTQPHICALERLAHLASSVELPHDLASVRLAYFGALVLLVGILGMIGQYAEF